MRNFCFCTVLQLRKDETFFCNYEKWGHFKFFSQKTLKPFYFRAIILFVSAGLPFVLASGYIATAFAGRNKNAATLIYSGWSGSCVGHDPTKRVYYYYERING